MLIRVKYASHGIPGDPVKSPMPTWSMVGFDPVAETMTISVPDDDLPAGWPRDGQVTTVDTAFGAVLTKLSPSAHTSWHEQLDAKYKEHAGEFRPQLV